MDGSWSNSVAADKPSKGTDVTDLRLAVCKVEKSNRGGLALILDRVASDLASRPVFFLFDVVGSGITSHEDRHWLEYLNPS